MSIKTPSIVILRVTAINPTAVQTKTGPSALPTVQARVDNAFLHMTQKFNRILSSAHSNPPKALRALGGCFTFCLSNAFGVNSRLWVLDHKTNFFHPLSSCGNYPEGAFAQVQFHPEYAGQSELQKCWGGVEVFLYGPVSKSKIAGNELEMRFMHYDNVAMLPVFLRNDRLGVVAIDFADAQGADLKSLLVRADDGSWHKGPGLKRFFAEFSQVLKSVMSLNEKSIAGLQLASHIQHLASNARAIKAMANEGLEALRSGNYAAAIEVILQVTDASGKLEESVHKMPSNGKARIELASLVSHSWGKAKSSHRINGSQLQLGLLGKEILNTGIVADFERLASAFSDILSEACASNHSNGILKVDYMASFIGGRFHNVIAVGHRGGNAALVSDRELREGPLSRAAAFIEGELEGRLVLKGNGDGSQSYYVHIPSSKNS